MLWYVPQDVYRHGFCASLTTTTSLPSSSSSSLTHNPPLQLAESHSMHVGHVRVTKMKQGEKSMSESCRQQSESAPKCSKKIPSGSYI
mmetsp:Transcript_11062/g.19817  ORF Transcript_11062/g.19817 Transcript_11062/m.19817 type:complete len:88 (+) Transcript_11062:81-344(+)